MKLARITFLGIFVSLFTILFTTTGLASNDALTQIDSLAKNGQVVDCSCTLGDDLSHIRKWKKPFMMLTKQPAGTVLNDSFVTDHSVISISYNESTQKAQQLQSYCPLLKKINVLSLIEFYGNHSSVKHKKESTLHTFKTEHYTITFYFNNNVHPTSYSINHNN